jgi:hypothetical protein
MSATGVCFFSGLQGFALASCETSRGKIAPFDSLDQDSLTMISRFLVAALSVLGPLTRRHQCSGHDRGLVHQQLLQQPRLQVREHGRLCEVAGWRAYLFQPPGTMAEFLEHLPEPGYTPWPHWISIDQAGDITGFYTDAAGVQHGFVRNPYGTITSFDPPEGNETNPTSISDGVAIVRGAGLRLALSAYRSGLAENFQPAE